MIKDPLNIGLIGAGRWGKNILKTIIKINDVNLSCVATKNKNIHSFISKDCNHSVAPL